MVNKNKKFLCFNQIYKFNILKNPTGDSFAIFTDTKREFSGTMNI